MIVDAGYSHYLLQFAEAADDGEVEFGPSGTLAVTADSLLVSCFTQGGPVSLRILVGDAAPGPAEDAWREEWETTQDVVFTSQTGLEVRTWEGGDAQPPSGNLLRAGTWRVRFHARGRDKVQDSSYVETPLEEHLLLIWPDGADSGAEPSWDEVVGDPSERTFRIEELSEFGVVKAPSGCYRLAGPQPDGQLGVPDEPGLVVGASEILIGTGAKKSLELQITGSEHAPGLMEMQWWQTWKPSGDGSISALGPLRLLDGDGVVPRAFSEPLMPPGNWSFRLYVDRERGDHMIQVWPAGARSREEEEAEWERFAEQGPNSDFDDFTSASLVADLEGQMDPGPFGATDVPPPELTDWHDEWRGVRIDFDVETLLDLNINAMAAHAFRVAFDGVHLGAKGPTFRRLQQILGGITDEAASRLATWQQPLQSRPELTVEMVTAATALEIILLWERDRLAARRANDGDHVVLLKAGAGRLGAY